MEVEVVVAVCAPAGGAPVVEAEPVAVELVDCGLVVESTPELLCEVVEVGAPGDGVVAAGVVIAPDGGGPEGVLRVVAVAPAVETAPIGLACVEPDR